MVSKEVQAEVRTHLAAIEREHDVRVLFACESGSRAWGFASPDSDFDVRFVYAHPRDWYLSIEQRRDVIDIPISGEMDIAGWDLRKALGLARAGNATLSEWLDSPVIYKDHDDFAARMRSLLDATYRRERAFMHYTSLARNHFTESPSGKDRRLKRFLYSLRTALAAQWCATREDRPPMTLYALTDALIDNADVRARIDALVELKSTLAEKSFYEPDAVVTEFLEHRIAALADAVVESAPAADGAVFDRFFIGELERS
ncbi:nucleotidyltransferase domain-containing protein [Demequina sp.]|uniref:nucleotidyltransferase domain-containing protein n=1 Tax=Demequina sp. TaxID=2050685 RepID=UPI003D0A6C18